MERLKSNLVYYKAVSKLLVHTQKHRVSQCCTYDANIKFSRFQKKCGTIPKSLKSEALRTPQLRFHRIMAVPALIYNSAKWALYRIDVKYKMHRLNS